jgi:putative ABC transport system permease protein
LLRSLLTTAGVVLGVALFVAMHTANDSVMFAFHQTVDRIAGATQLEITAGDSGFDEEVLERVESLPEVSAAAPVIEAVSSIDRGGQGNVLILGVDMTGDQSLRDYHVEGDDDTVVEDPLVFLAQPDSVILTKSFAQNNGYRIGSRVPMETMQGRKLLTVRGLMRAGGLASAFGGNLLIMDIYAAQKILGRGPKFDRIDLAVKDKFTVEHTKNKLADLLGPGFQVQEPSARSNEFDSISRIYSATANITSAFALFIGMFIIHNTLQIAVVYRRSEIGILRALGATRRQIMGLFLGEGAVEGVVGSAVGAVIGIIAARGITAYVSRLLGEVYGMVERATDVSSSPAVVFGAIFLGVATSIVAALIPARNAARVNPVAALQKGSYQRIGSGETRLRTLVAFVLVAVSAALLLPSRWRGGLYLSDFLALLAAILMVPALSVLLTRVCRPLLMLIRPVEGSMAADSILRAPRRAAGAVSALMLSLALVIALGGIAQGSYRAIYDWLKAEFSADLFVSPTQSLTAREFRFSGSMIAQLKAIPGIKAVESVREVRVKIRNAPILVIAADDGLLRRVSALSRVSGDPEKMYQRVVSGEGVLAAEAFTLLHGYRLGDVVDIPAPSGLLHLPIVGIVKEYSDQQGTVLMARDTFMKHWHDTTVNLFGVMIQPGFTELSVRRAISERFKSDRRLFILSNADVRKFILDLTDQWFGTTYIQTAIAFLVAVLGIVNAVTVSITDRRQELGVLQAVGAVRRQVRGTVWLEGILIGILGLTLGLLLGGIQLYFGLETAAHDISGLRLDYVYPYRMAIVLLGCTLLAAFLAAIGPAESVVRRSLVASLQYE